MLLDWPEENVCELPRGRQIHRREDKWGNILVIDYGRHRVLTFDSLYEQSRLDKEHPSLLAHGYTRAMMLGLAFVDPAHVTVLGLGGGCLVRAIHAMHNDTALEIVELRQAVVDVAGQYFGLPDSPLVHTTTCDAKHHLKTMATASTDILFSDMYHAYGMSPAQSEEIFLHQCHRVLTAAGWLVINVHNIRDFSPAFLAALQSIFAEVLVCDVPNENQIVYAGKQTLRPSLGSYLPRLERFPYQEQSRFDLLFARIARLEDRR